MKTITKYKAIDGKEFSDRDECVSYELLICRVDDIMSALPPKPVDDDCSFSGGEGFLQHDKSILRKVQLQLLEIMKEYTDHKWIQQTIDDENIDPSWVARIIGEYSLHPLNNAWYRFSCIDNLSREWGQPYFANNPEKGTQFSINQ